MSQRPLPLRRVLAATTAGLVLCGIVSTTGGTASAAPASGPDWTVTTTAGGYEVTLDLDEPLPLVDDAPTLTVDGVDLGVATQSADGLSLSVTTTDPAVAAAKDVEQTWASGDAAKVEPSDSPVTSTDAKIQAPKKITQKQLDAAVAAAAADGSAVGTYQYRQDDYDYGDQAIDLAGMTAKLRGELTGRIYLPTTGGARPTVILLHGRHTACATIPGTTGPTAAWPCTARQTEVPSFKGYDGTAQTLATQGYAVVSIGADAINAYDGTYGPDAGAQARGQLVLDSLAMIQKWNDGDPAVYHDDAKGTDLTIEQALDTPQVDLGTPDLNQLDAATLKGRFDLTNVGLMGHSRGGEGVTSAVTLNQALDKPFGIKSVLPLAPVDFSRMTVSNVPMLVMLPYCDGDVSNQQGQHFIDDSRYNHDDSVLRSTVYVMGANHNFFNTVWTPGKYAYSTSDDWGATSTDSVCGPAAPTNIRLSADDQYNVGTEYMSAWFRLTLGGENAFLPMFDGTVAKPTLSKTPAADIRVLGTAPSADRVDIARFTSFDSSIRSYGSSTAAICASASGRTLPQEKPYCATTSTLRSTSAMPHWTPASYAPNVPASPMMKFLWTSATGTTAGAVRVTVPAAARNASAYTTLSFKTAPDESVLQGTDLTVSVLDGTGKTWSSPVSALNPLAVRRMPASTSTTLNKIVLQQVSIPVTSMTGIDTTDIREVQLTAGGTAGLGADGTQTGGVYLSDLALSRSTIGTPVVTSGAPTINVDPTMVEEGSGPATKKVAVYLSKPSTKTTSGWFTLIGSTATTAKAGLAATQVVFAPGETCKAVEVPTYGDAATSAAPTTSYKTEIANNANVVYGKGAFGTLLVREDDGITPATAPAVTPAPAPAVGTQGDVCAERAARAITFALGKSVEQSAPGTAVVLTGTGYRPGESVSFTDGSTTPATVVGTVLADATGTARTTLTLAPDAALGTRSITAVGAGSGRTSATTLTVATTPATVPPTTTPTTPGTPTTTPTTPATPGGTPAAGSTPGAPTLSALIAKRTRSGTSLTLKVKVVVSGPTGAAVPTGTVQVKFGKVTKKVAVSASGTMTVKFGSARGGSLKKVKVTYGGDTRYTAAVQKIKTGF